MPLVIGQPLALSGRNKTFRPMGTAEGNGPGAGSIDIALINNMPDPALSDTESQFVDLLNAASGDLVVSVKLFSLPGLGRSDLVERRLGGVYFSTEDLLNWPFDAVIITGTEPRRTNLRDEAYWAALVQILDWAEHNTVSAVLSCLAAHAGVLYSDGIERHALVEKQFGVFEFRKVSPHLLTSGSRNPMWIPHSRWNEVQQDALMSCGYTVLTQSAKAGVDLFVKKKKRSLFVHFQGHPEYGTRTLLKEYQRDIKRFLRRERETYPSIPFGYFDSSATTLLDDFQQKALSHPEVELWRCFPEVVLAERLQNSWHSSAACMYRHWLQYVALRKAELRRSRSEVCAPHRSITAGLSNSHD